MEVSTSISGENSIKAYEKLAKIQSELFVPKDNKNSFGGYNYRTCEDILKAVKPIAYKYKAVVKLDTALTECGGRIYIKAIAKLFDLESGECVIASAVAREPEEKKGADAPQLSGSCLSYARKYAMAGLFALDNERDSDATNKEKIGEETHDTVSAQQLNAIYAELDRTGISESKIVDFIKKKKLEEATQEDYLRIMKNLNVTPDKDAKKEAK